MGFFRIIAAGLLSGLLLAAAGCAVPTPSEDLMEGIVPSPGAAAGEHALREDVADQNAVSEAFADFAVRLFRHRMRAAYGKSGETGFRKADLCCIHVDGKALMYEREAADVPIYRVGPRPGGSLYVPDKPNNREGPKAREPCKCLMRQSSEQDHSQGGPSMCLTSQTTEKDPRQRSPLGT